MIVSTEVLIQEKFEEEECPLFDGVLFGTGAIVLMESRTYVGDSGVVGQVRPLARSTLDSFLEYNPDGWVSFTSLSSSRWELAGLVLTCGEGSLGADGFVAVREIDGPLRWIAFFQNSNPFTSVSLAGDEVVALSTLNHLWRFPVDRPEFVRVTHATREPPEPGRRASS